MAIPLRLEATASRVGQSAIGPWFWSTIWIPFASYLWTAGWLISILLIQREAGSDSEIRLFSKWHIISMIGMDLFWLLAVAVFLTMAAVVICHGAGIGSVGAWAARTAIKVGTGTGFDFCAQVPEINF